MLLNARRYAIKCGELDERTPGICRECFGSVDDKKGVYVIHFEILIISFFTLRNFDEIGVALGAKSRCGGSTC